MLTVTLGELQEAEKTIIRCLQYEHFREELQILCDLNVTDGETNRTKLERRTERYERPVRCTKWIRLWTMMA